MKESVAQLGTGDLPQQLARLQSALEGQGAELATLKEQLSGAEAATGQLSEEAVARIDVYRAELDGLRAEVGTLQDRVAGLTAQVGQAVQNAEREIETARTRVETIRTEADTRLSAAEADANLALIRAAIESGAPFEAPLAALEGRAGVTIPPGPRPRPRRPAWRRWRGCATTSPTPRTRRSARASWPAPATG